MNAISSISGSGLAAIAAGSQQLNDQARQIANPDHPDVTGALVGTTQSLQLAQAGADVISTSNQMLGTLLDMFA
jgi:hypothetical protein